MHMPRLPTPVDPPEKKTDASLVDEPLTFSSTSTLFSETLPVRNSSPQNLDQSSLPELSLGQALALEEDESSLSFSPPEDFSVPRVSKEHAEDWRLRQGVPKLEDTVQINPEMQIDMDVLENCLRKIDHQMAKIKTLFFGNDSYDLKKHQDKIARMIFQVASGRQMPWDTKRSLIEGASEILDDALSHRPAAFNTKSVDPSSLIEVYLKNRISMMYRTENALNKFRSETHPSQHQDAPNIIEEAKKEALNPQKQAYENKRLGGLVF